MDPTLTRSQAHTLFGDLYRKERPPAAQAKVDEIVSSVSDIFVRIKRIEELDADIEKKERQANPKGGRGRGGPTGGKARSGNTPQQGRRPASGKEEGGFFSKLFGGSIAKWGQETGTISTGFLGLGQKLSPNIKKLFTLNEEHVRATIRSFRHAVINSWEDWEPERYNTLIWSYQFYNEFIKGISLFRLNSDPNQLINQSFKMQKYYGMMISIPGYKNVLLEDFPAYIRNQEEISGLVHETQVMMNYIVGLETRKPTLINIILAFYVMKRKALVEWSEIERELKLETPDLNSYRAPDAIKKKINTKIQTLRDKMNAEQEKIRNIDAIKSRFFKYDAGGKVQMDFLNDIMKQTLQHVFPQSSITEGTIKAYKSEPQKLLFVILRDLELVAVPLLSGAIMVSEGGAHEEIIVFKPALFKQNLLDLNMVTRDVETYVKKNTNLSYGFNQYFKDLKQESDDSIVREFLGLMSKVNRVFFVLAGQLRTMVENDASAREAEKSGHLADNVKRTKNLPIENTVIMQRFIPFSEKEIIASNRLNGKFVWDSLQELTRNLYNYLYIFRDQELITSMAGIPKIKQEIKSVQEELAKMGIESKD